MINTQDVVHETLDGEVVIVHLRLGHYYSLTDCGATLWSGLERSLDEESLARLLVRSYEIEDQEARQAVTEFLAQLASAGLIGPGDALEAPSDGQPDASRLPFHPPLLTPHDDMAGLLLLDPVHEVADAGWPALKN